MAVGQTPACRAVSVIHLPASERSSVWICHDARTSGYMAAHGTGVIPWRAWWSLT